MIRRNEWRSTCAVIGGWWRRYAALGSAHPRVYLCVRGISAIVMRPLRPSLALSPVYLISEVEVEGGVAWPCARIDGPEEDVELRGFAKVSEE